MQISYNTRYEEIEVGVPILKFLFHSWSHTNRPPDFDKVRPVWSFPRSRRQGVPQVLEELGRLVFVRSIPVARTYWASLRPHSSHPVCVCTVWRETNVARVLCRTKSFQRPLSSSKYPAWNDRHAHRSCENTWQHPWTWREIGRWLLIDSRYRFLLCYLWREGFRQGDLAPLQVFGHTSIWTCIQNTRPLDSSLLDEYIGVGEERKGACEEVYYILVLLLVVGASSFSWLWETATGSVRWRWRTWTFERFFKRALSYYTIFPQLRFVSGISI